MNSRAGNRDGPATAEGSGAIRPGEYGRGGSPPATAEGNGAIRSGEDGCGGSPPVTAGGNGAIRSGQYGCCGSTSATAEGSGVFPPGEYGCGGSTSAAGGSGGSTTPYLSRLDGRIKTCFFMAAVVVVSVVELWQLAAGAFFTALVLMFTLRLPLKKVLWRMCVPFGVAWLVLASLAFSTGHTVVGTIGLGHFSLPVYREGIALGFLIMLRILAAVSLAMLLSFSTPMVEILATLRLLKVPGLIVDLADMIYRYALSMEEVGATMRKAQRARGGEGLPWHRQARDVGTVAGNLLVKSFDRSVRIYKAMLARGYDEDAKAQPYFTCPVPPKDMLTGVLAGLVLVAVLVCNFAFVWKGW